MNEGLTGAVMFVLALNVVLFISQMAIVDINPNFNSKYFEYEGSEMESYDDSGYNIKEFEPGDLPDAQTSVSEEGNFFTDIFSSIKNWLLETTGLKYLLGIVNTVPNFLKMIGLPIEISFALGYFWYAFTVFLIVAWLKS